MASKYTINVSDSRIEDLNKRLSLASFPDELEDAEWEYGAPLADVKRLTVYWENTFDWRKAESKLNELPNFKTALDIDGFGAVDVHFLHQPSPNNDAIPLLFCHGWPGSYIEVSKMLPLLAASDVKFHVVALSMPNFGWSGVIKKKGFALAQYAETCHKLMLKLGYPKYVTQGGDWGFYVTRAISLLYPEACKASHINMIRASPPSWSEHPLLALAHASTPYTEAEQKGMQRSDWFATEGSGYRLLQSTKPQTLGYALHDSPVALLAWIYEKLHDWTDSYPWTDDEILTWVSIYWFSTAGPAASVRIYYEATHSGTEVTRERVQKWIPTVPLGLCYAPKELTVVPRTWGRTLGPVAYESEQPSGGHFLAWEKPDEVVADLKAMFGPSGPCADVTK